MTLSGRRSRLIEGVSALGAGFAMKYVEKCTVIIGYERVILGSTPISVLADPCIGSYF